MRTWLGAFVLLATMVMAAHAQTVSPFALGDQPLTGPQREAMYANWRELAETGDIGDVRTWGGGEDPQGEATLERRYERDGMSCVELVSRFVTGGDGDLRDGLTVPACKTPDGWKFAF